MRTEPTRKRHDIELLRVLSAFAIVCFHAHAAGSEITYGGLVFFLMLSPYLAEQAGPRDGPIARLAIRMLLPWVFWAALFGAANLLHGRAMLPFGDGPLTALLAGPAIHLWYLPFMFIVLAVHAVTQARTAPVARAQACGLAAALLLALVPWWRAPSIEAGAPLAQYAQALPGVLLGVFFAGLARMRRVVAAAIGAAVLAAAVAALRFPGVGMCYLVGIAAFSVVLSGRLAAMPIGPIARIAPLMFGVYLVHPLFLRRFYRLGVLQDFSGPVVAFILSTIVVWLFRRWAQPLAARVT